MSTRKSKRLKTANEQRGLKDDEIKYKTVGQAARANRVDVMKRLIKEGHPVDAADNRGWMPIHEVAYQNNIPGMKLLLKYKATNVNWEAHDKTTALHLSACNKYIDCSEMLIKHGARVNQEDHMGMTPLLKAIESSQTKQVDLLLAHGADVNHVAYDDETALFKAVTSDSPSIVRRLLRRGVPIEGGMKITVLMQAARLSHYASLKYILQHMKNTGQLSLIDQRPQQLPPPLALAVERGIPYDDMAECVQILLQYGADPNMIYSWRDGIRKTALHAALERRKIGMRCLKLLLSVTDHEIFKSCQRNPFHIVLERGAPYDLILTRFLIDAGLDVNELYNEQKPVPLVLHSLPYYLSFFYTDPPYDFSHSALTHLCTMRKFPNRMELANVLLSSGALVNARNSHELPPILPALQRIALAKVLIRCGANLNVYHPKVFGNMTVLTCVDKRMWKPLELILYAGAEVDSLFKFAPPYEPVDGGLFLGKRFYHMVSDEIDEMLSFILQFAGPITLQDVFVSFILGDVRKQKVVELAAAQFTLQNICRQKIRRQIPHKIMFDANVRWYKPDYVKPLCLPPSLLDYVFYKGKYRRINRRKY